MKIMFPALALVSALGLGSASAFTVITGNVVEFTGPDDLLLDPATSVIAVSSFGQNDAGLAEDLTVNGVTFWSDNVGGANAGPEGVVTVGGVSVTTGLVNQINNWSGAGGGPAFTGTDAGNLSQIMRDIRWANANDAAGNTTINVGVAGLNPGGLYNVQLLFNEGAGGRDRRWDIGVNGLLAVDDFSSYGGNGAWTPGNSFAYSGDFNADGTGGLSIVLGREPLPGDPNNTPFGGADNNAILQGVVIHLVPEPSSTALLGLGMLALVARRKRRG